jgi:pyroglutamyl-peptidase
LLLWFHSKLVTLLSINSINLIDKQEFLEPSTVFLMSARPFIRGRRWPKLPRVLSGNSAMTILLTGFEPFAGLAYNPSFEIAARLDGQEIGGHRIVGRLLPVDFARYHTRLDELLREVSPALCIGFGLASGEDMIRIERFGVNLADFDIPDNAGARPVGRAIESDGPAARAASLPCAEIRTTLLEAGIPARLSNSAGSYLCNATLYSALGLCEARRIPCGFIHLPYASHQVADLLRTGTGPLNGESLAPSLPIETMIAAAEIVLQISAATLQTA